MMICHSLQNSDCPRLVHLQKMFRVTVTFCFKLLCVCVTWYTYSYNINFSLHACVRTTVHVLSQE